MSIVNKTVMTLITFVVFCASAAAESSSDPTGIWLTEAGDAKVQIVRCGTTICGTIVWLKSPIDSATGKPQVDDKNPDPAKVRNPIVGLSLFLEMKLVGTKWSGRIYNADNGKTYASNVSLVRSNALKVEGCVLVLCGSETWRKLADLATAVAAR